MRNLKDKDVSLNYDVLKKIRIGLAFAGLLLFAFVAWQILEVHRGPTVFDDAIRFKVYEMRDDRLTPFVRAVTYFGNWQTTIIIAGLLVLCKKNSTEDRRSSSSNGCYFGDYVYWAEANF